MGCAPGRAGSILCSPQVWLAAGMKGQGWETTLKVWERRGLEVLGLSAQPKQRLDKACVSGGRMLQAGLGQVRGPGFHPC